MSVMKVYVTDGIDADIGKLEEYCRLNGWEIKLIHRIGRPRMNHDVKKVMNAYECEGTVRGAARRLDLNPGAVWRILEQEGILKRNQIDPS